MLAFIATYQFVYTHAILVWLLVVLALALVLRFLLLHKVNTNTRSKGRL
jgi:hypothetical protein